MSTATVEEQIFEKISLLDPIQKKTVYDFVNFLLSQQTQTGQDTSALLNVSVWEEEAIEAVEEAQRAINLWQPESY